MKSNKKLIYKMKIYKQEIKKIMKLLIINRKKLKKNKFFSYNKTSTFKNN